jgi:hypothetical protein
MPVRRSTLYLWLVCLAAAVTVAAYIYFYVGQPLSGQWNDVMEALLICLAAISSAVAATFTWRHFPAADRGPRNVWGNFALAFWFWAGAEAIILGYLLLGIEPPLLTAADVLWMAGYIFFGGALIHQYHLVYRSSRTQETAVALGVAAAVFVVSLAVTALVIALIPSEKTWLEMFVSILYPFLDLAVGLAALRLVYVFGGRLWSRPWFGLFVFALADGFYAWLVVAGIYDYFVATGNPLSLAADVLYLAAYLVVTIACYSQLLLLRFGLPRLAVPEVGGTPTPPAAESPAPPPSQPPASS